MPFLPSLNQQSLAHLRITFVIVGGGIAGLACAIALLRVGHRVVVIEQGSHDEEFSGGIRLAPNVTKILINWGLERELRSIAATSSAVIVSLCETAEYLGSHHWDEEFLREVRGDYVFACHADVRRLLYRTAIRYGAKFYFRSKVVDINPNRRVVKLASGQIFRADVIIGADGSSGLSRRQFLRSEGKADSAATPSGLMMYNITVPKEVMAKDPELWFFYDQPCCTQFLWFGDGRGVISYPLGGAEDFALQIYAPSDGVHRPWEENISTSAMLPNLRSCEPRLQKMIKLAKPATCIQMQTLPKLDNWVHESGRMVLVGEASHPLPPGALQSCAMAVEDGAVLAELFSHLLSEDQISTFLWAFQDLRYERLGRMLQSETKNVFSLVLPPGEIQQMRDQDMRDKHRAGKNVFESEGGDIAEQWEEIKAIFGYDAADEAGNWWVKWGLLRERARGSFVPAVNWGMSIKSVEVVEHTAVA